MNKRLLRVARYLGSQGLYKEAHAMNKLAMGRPTAQDIKDKAENIKSFPGSMRYSIMGEIEQMAEGEDGGGVREYYHGWEDEDFQKLLDIIEGKVSDEESEFDGGGDEASRPTDQEIQDKIEDIKSRRGMMRYSIMNEFREMAEGGDGGDVRQYYPGWEDEDFQRVIDGLE